MKKAIVTGSCGLIGLAVTRMLLSEGYHVLGIDNNRRMDFFGDEGSTVSNIEGLCELGPYVHRGCDITTRPDLYRAFRDHTPDLVVHTAAQPSHDLARERPLDDFNTNALGTLLVLEATRELAPEALFVHFSTSKVYGDNPNTLDLQELETRYEFKGNRKGVGINEQFSIDHCLHSLFGVSKIAGDLYAQEYHKTFGLRTVILRPGCLTGSEHQGVELHGYLNYLARCHMENRPYVINGYKGKQVRDQIHAEDIASLVRLIAEHPREGEVYNVGGGYENAASMLENITMLEEVTGRPFIFSYSDENRLGDHIVYYSDMSKLKGHYPEFRLEWSQERIVEDMCKVLS